MWFWLSIAALICWSGSDLFSKIGCSDPSDKRSHLKMVTAVGMVMGLHAAYEIFIGKTEISFDIILTYLPVSLLYIGSMALGYISLRYIELSVSSPICNSSGALVAIMCLITGGIGQTSPGQLVATAIICIGVVGLGFAEAYEDEEKRAARQKKGNRKYSKSALAIILPLAYCLLDAAGTFADSLVLKKLSEDSANVAYELTFFTAGICTLIYTLFIKKEKPVLKRTLPKYIGAVCETAGQFAYIYAIGDSEHVMLAAPIISAYCAASVVWSRIFLKERMSWKHYLAIAVTVVGIVIMGIFDI